MDYPLNASAARFALSAVLTAVGALAWASLAATRVEGAWRVPAVLGAALVFIAVCALDGRAAARRRPRAIRLLGANRAILYFPIAPGRRGAPVALHAVDVTIERTLHWPGRLAGMRLIPAAIGQSARARAARPGDVLIFADAMPTARFHSLGIHLRCIGRGVTLVEYR